MKTRTIYLFCAFALIGISASVPEMLTSGAPPASTGAPQEKTCATSGCHSDKPLNNGPGNISINFNNGVLQYEPGKIYDIMVTLSQDSIKRFGFELVALKNANDSNTGEIIITDTDKMQIVSAMGKKYITYKYPGTNPVSDGKGQWQFKWKAPDNNEGPITFYTAGVAANNNAVQTGDDTYTNKLVIGSFPLSVSNYPTSSSEIILKNASKDAITIQYFLQQKSSIEISIFDIQGKLNATIVNEMAQTGDYLETYPIHAKGGIYIMKIRINNRVYSQKICIL